MKNNFWSKLNRPILALAPMAGITDSAYREICRKYGADVTYSEMASATALFYSPCGIRRYAASGKAAIPQGKSPKTLELIKFGAGERPYIVQLFGKTPEHFAAAAKIISNLPNQPENQFNQKSRKPDGIDINFGCPAKKVFGHGSGCALMPQKKLAREIISAVCENTDLPVSIKIRAGILKNSQSPALGISALAFIENTKDLPYSAVMVHCRTYEGGFSGEVDFSVAEKVKKIIPDKIVLGNGGIYTPEDAKNILDRYPLLDGLGIARGAWGRPWIFNEIKGNKGKGLEKYDFPRIKKIMLQHAKLIHKNKGKKGLFEIRKHMSWYIKGFPGAADLRRKLVTAESLEEIEKILGEL